MKFLQQVQEWAYSFRHLLATAGVGLLAVLLAWHVVFGANGALTYQHKRAEHRALQEEIQGLEQQNSHLQQQIKGLRSDPKMIEKEAREQLRYVRPGEVVYTLPGEAPPKAPPARLSARER